MWWLGPYIVPIAVFIWLAVVGVAKIIGQAHSQRLKAEQCMAMVQRGMTAEQIATVLQPEKDTDEEEPAKTKDPLRSLSNARRAGIVLVSTGLGLTAFGWLLALIVGDHEVLVVAAAGLIPLCIGIGFFVDYSLQKRELARFGLEVAADQPPQNLPRN
jgi:Flp pilus assembly protein TadB